MKNVSIFLLMFLLFISIFCSLADGKILEKHPVWAINEPTTGFDSMLGVVAGATKKKKFGDIESYAYWQVYDDGSSKAECSVISEVTMQAILLSFVGFGSISGTADAGHTKQFAGQQKDAVRTDKGVLDSAKHPDTKAYTVQTSLVNEGGRPISLDISRFTAYKKWYDKAPKKEREKWGDSETFSYKHSDNSFYTAMKRQPVHTGVGIGDTLFFWDHEEARDLSLSEMASLRKQKVGKPTDKQIVGMFSPYAQAHGESETQFGKDADNTIRSVSVSTDDPKAPKPTGEKQGAIDGAYNYGLLLAVNDAYTEVGGGTHEAVFYLSNSGTVKWYVKAPGETGRGTLIETDTDTDEATFLYTFEDNAQGYYDITAVVEPASGPGYEDSYAVYVTPKGTTSSAISYTLVSSDGVYTAVAGESHTADVSVPVGWTQIYWYLRSPGESYETSQSSVSDSTGNSTTASYTYSFPSGVSGDYVLKAYVYLSDSTIVEPSYTVSVSLPSSTPPSSPPSETPSSPSPPSDPVVVPVWSDIPDPYNLTVGDSFYLDLSSYVTGSPTFTRNGGVIPAGLSFSYGVISGTVTSVESRGFRFTATNSAGSADSEWINITVSAAP